LRRFIESDAQHESGGLIEQAESLGADRLDACGDRQRVCVAGEVRSIRVDTRGGSPVLEVEVYDGTAMLTAVFLGRRSVAGLDAGRSVRLRGRLSCVNGEQIIYNPAYELLATAPAGK
jgi:RecG-like helicase